MFRSPVNYATCLCLLSMLLAAAGCTAPSMFYQAPPPPEMLGTKVDQLNQMQEENAEASKFVIYQHEFELNKTKEGETAYQAGDYLVSNNQDGTDAYAISAEKFQALYDIADE